MSSAHRLEPTGLPLIRKAMPMSSAPPVRSTSRSLRVRCGRASQVAAGPLAARLTSISADVFVTKLNVRGDTIIYSTYLGGNDDDCGEGIAVDSSGNAYVAGETLSTDFPVTPGAFQPACASCSKGMVDTFAAKLSRDGSSLVYSTYLGGNDEDLFPMLALDRFGNLYIQGSTYSSDYPTTPGAFQPACASCANGNPDTYVTKVNPDGTALVYSTYLGGSDFEFCGAQIAVDSVGSAYVSSSGEYGWRWALRRHGKPFPCSTAKAR